MNAYSFLKEKGHALSFPLLPFCWLEIWPGDAEYLFPYRGRQPLGKVEQ